MPVKRLTETAIAKITPPLKGRKDITDSVMQGLNIRVSSTGVKSWCHAYRYGGKQIRMTFGRWPDISLVQARQIVKEHKVELAMGNNPVALRDAKIIAELNQEQENRTIANFSAEFIEKYVKPHHKRPKDTIRFIKNHILPAFGDRAARDITRKDVIKLLEQIKSSSRPSAANHVLVILRRMYNWAIEQDELEVNPCLNIKKPVAVKERERVLSKNEIHSFWQACDEIGYPYGPLCKLLLLTGQRCNEIARLKWDYIDFNERVIRISAANTKAKRSHDVPLSGIATDILMNLPRFSGPYIFTSGNGIKPVNGFSKTKKRFEEYFNPKDDWRFHDLRRTCATGMAQEGIALHTISRVLNHSEGGITRLYARHSYLSEKREALDLWANTVVDIIGDKDSQNDNVVSLKEARYGSKKG
jgi:integrase